MTQYLTLLSLIPFSSVKSTATNAASFKGNSTYTSTFTNSDTWNGHLIQIASRTSPAVWRVLHNISSTFYLILNESRTVKFRSLYHIITMSRVAIRVSDLWLYNSVYSQLIYMELRSAIHAYVLIKNQYSGKWERPFK